LSFSHTIETYELFFILYETIYKLGQSYGPILHFSFFFFITKSEPIGVRDESIGDYEFPVMIMSSTYIRINNCKLAVQSKNRDESNREL
jgi:hypothetical protein